MPKIPTFRYSTIREQPLSLHQIIITGQPGKAHTGINLQQPESILLLLVLFTRQAVHDTGQPVVINDKPFRKIWNFLP